MKYILAGECALSANEIIQLAEAKNFKQVWTLYKITPITEGVPVAYYWNPYADKPFLTQEREDGFLVPTCERALIEYMMFADYFSEEFLIEGLQSYMDIHSDLSELCKVAEQMRIREDVVEYWLKEARESDWI